MVEPIQPNYLPQVRPGDLVRVRLHQGEIHCEVKDAQERRQA